MAINYQGTSGTRRIRFTSNVSYEGVDYGPDYPEQEVDVAPNEALRFVREGRARYVEAPTADRGPQTEEHAKAVAGQPSPVVRSGLDTKSAGAATELVNPRAGGGRK